MESNAERVRVQNFQTFSVSRKIDVNPNSTDIAVIKHVGSNKRVLELGCATGHMSQAMRAKGCVVVGIEINPEAAARAAESCERVITADLDYMNFDQELGSDQFDVVVAADILEHLKDPESVLKTIKKFMAPGGYLVGSIPNIAHLSVRLALLSGRFPYGDQGLLDRTHLRFFTRDSMEKLFEDAGFVIGHLERIDKMPTDPPKFEVPYDPESVPRELLESLSQDPEASTYQFVVVSYPLPHSGLAFIQERMRDLAWQAENARQQIAHLSLQLEEATAQEQTLQGLLQRSQAAVHDLEGQIQSLSGQAARSDAETIELRHALEQERKEVISLQEETGRYKRNNSEADHLIESLREEDARQKQIIAELSETSALVQQYASQLHGTLEEQKERLADAELLTDSLRHENARQKQNITELSKTSAFNEQHATELRGTVEEQKQRIAGLGAQVETLFAREKDLREMLLEAHDQLLRRDEEIASTLATALTRPHTVEASTAPAPPPAAAPPDPGKYLRYQQILPAIRELVRNAVPQGGTVLVISKGDDELLKLDPCTGLHFPQNPDGVYAGHYPADGAIAIAHLEELRERGAQFLLIPQTSMWWLDHYNDLRDYLNQHFFRIIDQPDICVAFRLTRFSAFDRAVSYLGAERPASQRPFGVNVSGHLTSEKGVGEAVRSQIRSLEGVGVPLILNDAPDDTAVNIDHEFSAFSLNNPYSVNLIHLNADALELFAEWKTEEYFQDRYNIGYWAWETPTFPKQWWNRFKLLDEIWVGSDFVLDAVSRVSSVPVIKVLLAIPDRLSLATLPRAHFGLSKDTFVFLFVFDFMSVFQRKNPLAVVEAFRNAFSKREDVTLVLKCLHSESNLSDMKALKQACRGLNVKIIDDLFSREETTSLMNAADCYVSLHRSEGFGLTLAEAMSLGKPVIATAFSGNMDFMTPTNSYLVKYKLIDIDGSYGPYEEGMWADPDVNHAAKLMRHVFKHRDTAVETGRQARADITRLLNQKRLGNLMRDRLLRIAELGKITHPATEPIEVSTQTAEKNGSYLNLVGRIRDVVHDKVRAKARIVVVSKGDDGILRFENRHGVHFPQTSDGTYAGHYPADDAEAIGHLEQLRIKGGEYLLFPQTAFWWLDYYTDFRTHLESQYRRIWADPDCIIYKLARRNKGTNQKQRTRKGKARGVVDSKR